MPIDTGSLIAGSLTCQVPSTVGVVETNLTHAHNVAASSFNLFNSAVNSVYARELLHTTEVVASLEYQPYFIGSNRTVYTISPQLSGEYTDLVVLLPSINTLISTNLAIDTPILVSSVGFSDKLLLELLPYELMRYHINSVNTVEGNSSFIDTSILVNSYWLWNYYDTVKVKASLYTPETFLHWLNEIGIRQYVPTVGNTHQDIDFISKEHVCHHSFQSRIYESPTGYYTVSPNGLVQYLYPITESAFRSKYRETYIGILNSKNPPVGDIHLSDNYYSESEFLKIQDFEGLFHKYIHSTNHFNSKHSSIDLNYKEVHSVGN